LVLAVSALPELVTADQSAGGLVLTPAFQTVQIKATDARLPFEVTVTNRDKIPQSFGLSTVDFGSLDEEGGVAFLGAPANELEHKYGLAAWLELSQKTITVGAGQTVKVQAAIVNRDSLTAGGHYGAVLATAQLANGAVKGEQVGVQQVLSSLVLAVKEGDIKTRLELDDLKIPHTFAALPLGVSMRFHNGGNVHAVVRGIVSVTDMRGHKVAQGELNEGSTLVLPDSNRRYQIKLRSVDRAWLPGLYQVTVAYRDESTADFQTVSRNIFYVGSLVVWLVVFLSFGAAGLLAWWLFAKRSSYRGRLFWPFRRTRH
jgi:hypothetical protein